MTDRGDGHLDRELDRVVGPHEPLLGLHLLRELGHPSLELFRVAEQSSEAFHASDRSGPRSRGLAGLPCATGGVRR
jgi:hypothetical protein